MNFSDVADVVIPVGYAHASGGSLPVAQRQLYYACRERFRELTGREIQYPYFSQKLLNVFVRQNSELTRNWKITADPRGKVIIPNTRSAPIPCGTLAVDGYLERHVWGHQPTRLTADDPLFQLDSSWPANSPGERYQAVLYIEKEGFEPLLEAADIANRYALVIVSCKGQSVVAARKFVDEICGGRNIPLLVAHDLDIHGFRIGRRLVSNSAKAEENGSAPYEFKHDIEAIDLGLRLEDVEKYGLQMEHHNQTIGEIDQELGLTAEEEEFLQSQRRVELNAFSSPQFVQWLEAGLKSAGIKPDSFIPRDEVLGEAWQRARTIAEVQASIDAILKKLSVSDQALPDDLRSRLLAQMDETGQPWDLALSHIAKECRG